MTGRRVSRVQKFMVHLAWIPDLYENTSMHNGCGLRFSASSCDATARPGSHAARGSRDLRSPRSWLYVNLSLVDSGSCQGIPHSLTLVVARGRQFKQGGSQSREVVWWFEYKQWDRLDCSAALQVIYSVRI